MSSIPSGTKSLIPVGTKIKFSVKKIDLNSGNYLINQTNILNIQKHKQNSMVAHFWDGKKSQWSVQSVSDNALLPPLRWYKKDMFDIQRKITGKYDSIYPINVGSKANFSIQTLRGGGVVGSQEMNCNVTRSTQIVFQGDSKDIFVIVCNSKGENVESKTIHYYSPEFNLSLKTTTTETKRNKKTEEVIEVTSIEKPKAN